MRRRPPRAAQQSEELTEVVVTGIRRQLETSQARKQEATELVDAITADDIGALPRSQRHRSAAAHPGLAIGRVPQPRDADRIAIEGAGVTIRGLSWVRSELNGHSAFSAKNSRTLGFEDIPPELLAGVDVYKNPLGAADRRRPLGQREPAHPAAVRLRGSQDQLLARRRAR
jgi:hypothetical protein